MAGRVAVTGVQARLMTAAQLCAYLGGITTSTLHRWIDDGRIPGPIKGTTRWDIRAVDAALDKLAGLPSRLTSANDAGDDKVAANRAALDARFSDEQAQG